MKNLSFFSLVLVLLIPMQISAQSNWEVSYPISDTNNGDWTEQHVVLFNTPETEMMVRSGDIDNVGFGWPANFDPFSGQSTPSHGYPWTADTVDAMGTDRIMVITSYVPGGTPCGQDGYTSGTSRPENLPRPIKLSYSLSGMDISTAALQIFVDDFQAPVWCADYFVTINGYDIPKLAVTINNLVQTGPIGKIITYVFPQDQLFLLLNDSLSIMFDDTTTGAGDGYAIDFVKLMINLEGFAYTGKIYGYVNDLNTGLPIEEVKVILEDLSEVMTDQDGYYIMTDVPAGINYFMSTKFGYDTASAIVDLVAGDSLQRDFTIEEILDAEFIAVPTGGVYPLTVQFSDLSTQDPTEWHWDFGDGDTSVLQNPGHTYNSAGIYTVSLRASNELEANTETKIDYIEVGTFGLNEMGSPTTFQIYPNPFTTSTNLSYTLERSENIRFTIYNLQGQIVYTMQQSQEMGDQKLEWNAEGLPAGIYYFRIQAGDKVCGGKIIKISDI